MKKSIVELAVEHHLGFIAESNGSLFVNEGYKEKELQAFAAALKARWREELRVESEPMNLMGEKLIDYVHKQRREACGAWSDVREINGEINVAKCDYAAAVENRLECGINELYSALIAARQAGRDEQREVDAKICEHTQLKPLSNWYQCAKEIRNQQPSEGEIK
jgi:hypothetical protein